ncbi:hypothetical protein [Altererythrobacter sp. MTPC7]|uniref:hypothetical protein n=1 Tax=Altererythrobacter sp. MTPC7 TaxID=3056567 RepID=UPI0036F1E074
MSGPMLRNRVAAIAIVVLTLAGVASLVGTEDNEGALTSATKALAEKAAASSETGLRNPDATAPAAVTDMAAPPPSAQFPTEFADDESLIDDARGFDPSPVVDDPAEGEVVGVVEGNENGVSQPGAEVLEP